MKSVGIALGGGGAKGLSHILMLEALEELGVKPARISGTSIGAIVGALYADGASAAELREHIENASIGKMDSIPEAIFKSNVLNWFEFIGLPGSKHELISVDEFITQLEKTLSAESFEQLEIPLQVVASDFWSRKAAVFDKGPLVPAVHASMALPGVFEPVSIDDRVLIDGGAVNPVPYDLIQGHCDIVIAIDVMGSRGGEPGEVPSISEALFNTFQIMQHSILLEKLRQSKPDIYIEPDIVGIKVLEFYKGKDVFAQAETAKDQLKKELSGLLD